MADLEDKAAQGVVDDDADDGNMAYESTSDEQAVEELLEGEKEENASDRGDAGEEFKPDIVSL
jgi:hypothetical protein